MAGILSDAPSKDGSLIILANEQNTLTEVFTLSLLLRRLYFAKSFVNPVLRTTDTHSRTWHHQGIETQPHGAGHPFEKRSTPRHFENIEATHTRSTGRYRSLWLFVLFLFLPIPHEKFLRRSSVTPYSPSFIHKPSPPISPPFTHESLSSRRGDIPLDGEALNLPRKSLRMSLRSLVLCEHFQFLPLDHFHVVDDQHP